MSLIHDCHELKSAIDRLDKKASEQQFVYFNLINAIVKMAQEHRIAKDYKVSDELRDILNSVGVRIIQGTAGYSTYESIPESLRNTQVDDRWEWNKKRMKAKP